MNKERKKYLQGGVTGVMAFPFALTAEEIKSLYNGEWVGIYRYIRPDPRATGD